MKKLGILCMCVSIFIGLIIDCNGFKDNNETIIIVSWLVFLLGIYFIILFDDKAIK